MCGIVACLHVLRSLLWFGSRHNKHTVPEIFPGIPNFLCSTENNSTQYVPRMYTSELVFYLGV